MEPITKLTIKRRNREALRKLGEKGETYDEIIEKLLKHWSGGRSK